MKLLRLTITGLMGLVVASTVARADFQEDFNSPTGANRQVVYKADTMYLATGALPSGGDAFGNSQVNGFITKTTNNPNIVGGAFGNGISNDQSGSSFFLFTGTGGNLSQVGVVWESFAPTAVVANTDYTFSFYMTNANSSNISSIQPFINGTDLGGPVSAAGFFTDGNAADQWQLFSVNWFSGASTTADLGLRNLQGNTGGNDFGLDTISLTAVRAVPEPGSLTLCAIGGLALLGVARRRLATRKSFDGQDAV